MAFQVGDVGRCIVKLLLPDGVQALNIFTAEYLGPSGSSFDTALTEWQAYIESFYSPYQASVPPEVTMGEATLQRLVSPGPPVLWETAGFFTPSFTGTNINEMLPHGVSPYLLADLDGPGRGTAKKFLPGLNEGATVGSTIDASVMAILEQMRQVWESNFGTIGTTEWTPATWTPGRGTRRFIRTKVSPIVGYQRRRKPGVGM